MTRDLFDTAEPEAAARYIDDEKKVDEFIGTLDKAVRDLIYAGNACLSRGLFPGERQRFADALGSLSGLNNDLTEWLKNSVKDRIHLNPLWLRT
jgi:hypothetical protein